VSIAKRDPVAPVLGQPVLLGDSLQPAVGHRQLHLNVVLPVLGLVVSPQRCQWPVHASFTYIAYNTIFRLLSFAFTDSFFKGKNEGFIQSSAISYNLVQIIAQNCPPTSRKLKTNEYNKIKYIAVLN
jgi:hypothetical protein